MSDTDIKNEELVRKVTELLNEEKWTRATLSNYTINNFKELDGVLDEVFAAGQADGVKAACLDHLHHTKNSIIALYVSGIIAMKQHVVDDANLVMLVNIFADNHKWNIIEYLSERILQYGENKFALRTLADCYSNENAPGRPPLFGSASSGSTTRRRTSSAPWLSRRKKPARLTKPSITTRRPFTAT
ncbi:MAG: hypothetical protein HC888_14700 [Candidatus Competibacteraceae bacterium]|nr:hypothetical protein [Candidatus Competibacteraceae bacterium]